MLKRVQKGKIMKDTFRRIIEKIREKVDFYNEVYKDVPLTPAYMR